MDDLQAGATVVAVPRLVQRTVDHLPLATAKARRAWREPPVLDRLLERGRDLLAHACLFEAHHRPPRQQFGVRRLDPRADPAARAALPGAGILASQAQERLGLG